MPDAGWAWIRIGLICRVSLLIVAGAGCGSTKMSETPRTATEQMLLTNAWDNALRKIDFRALTGVPVYLDTQYVSAIDQGYVVSSMRQALLSQGVLLKPKPEQAQWVVEARVGVYGTNSHNMLLGVAQTTIPPTITGLPTGTIPELAAVKRNSQEGVAKLAFFAYDRSSGQFVWRSGTSMAKANAKDVYIGGLGPFQSGSIRKGTEINGLTIPLSLDGSPGDEGETASGQGPLVSPPMSMPISPADRDSFVP